MGRAPGPSVVGLCSAGRLQFLPVVYIRGHVTATLPEAGDGHYGHLVAVETQVSELTFFWMRMLLSGSTRAQYVQGLGFHPQPYPT